MVKKFLILLVSFIFNNTLLVKEFGLNFFIENFNGELYIQSDTINRSSASIDSVLIPFNINSCSRCNILISYMVNQIDNNLAKKIKLIVNEDSQNKANMLFDLSHISDRFDVLYSVEHYKQLTSGGDFVHIKYKDETHNLYQFDYFVSNINSLLIDDLNKHPLFRVKSDNFVDLDFIIEQLSDSILIMAYRDTDKLFYLKNESTVDNINIGKKVFDLALDLILDDDNRMINENNISLLGNNFHKINNFINHNGAFYLVSTISYLRKGDDVNELKMFGSYILTELKIQNSDSFSIESLTVYPHPNKPLENIGINLGTHINSYDSLLYSLGKTRNSDLADSIPIVTFYFSKEKNMNLVDTSFILIDIPLSNTKYNKFYVCKNSNNSNNGNFLVSRHDLALIHALEDGFQKNFGIVKSKEPKQYFGEKFYYFIEDCIYDGDKYLHVLDQKDTKQYEVSKFKFSDQSLHLQSIVNLHMRNRTSTFSFYDGQPVYLCCGDGELECFKLE